ncbi:transporter substrate-binding domain-containing protein [Silvanigrella aquatica]|uniref:Solute-binding protein family 3/N-terminal domain-containing protein n=1 Tax=Silvanigrella aquatica TaxID=1915309 RepID=A0A1L4CY30_9BACT|nr:transporter substrate-binding domain-containing protein [Silvanigrella aquatica]APJ02840.1 hypothetical protein AXG55_02455 [Silvanigrella aquatica]
MLKYLFVIFSIINLSIYAKDLNISVCVNDIQQIPQILLANNKIVGSEIDILNLAVKKLKGKLNIKFNIEMIPWIRCIYMAEKGEVDAVLNASYNNERAQFLDYPPDASSIETSPCSSKYLLTCAGYAVVTLNSDPYEYDGNPKNIPKPVRASRGYSIVEELQKIIPNDLEIDKDDMTNVKKLALNQKGSAVVFSSYFNKLKHDKELLKKVKLNKKMYVMKSYYLAFSKKKSFQNEDKLMLWREIGAIANDKKLNSKIESKYLMFK